MMMKDAAEPNKKALEPSKTIDSASSKTPWETPAMRRLAASAAELGTGTHVDAEGMS
jgi:hypothetical protein